MSKKLDISVKQAKLIGELTIYVLNLEPCKFDPPRYNTDGGPKTAEGLGRTIAQIVLDTPL